MKDINYSEVNGYLFPNLKGREEVKVNSYFAQMKLKYLKTNEQGHLFSFVEPIPFDLVLLIFQ